MDFESNGTANQISTKQISRKEELAALVNLESTHVSVIEA